MGTLRSEIKRLRLADSEEPEVFNRRLKEYPTNRTGKPVMWAKWIIRKKLPLNHASRCCLCGWVSNSSALKKRAFTKKIQEKVELSGLKCADRLKVCPHCNTHERSTKGREE